MASYHFSVSVIGRASGRSAVAAAAYRAGEKLKNERDGELHDYTKKRGVLASGIELPDGAPARWRDRSTLWNEVEKIERGGKAQLAREVTLAIPHELPADEREEFVRDVAQELFVERGMVVDWAIHDADEDGHNIHAHFLMPMRSCDSSGFLAKSENVYRIRRRRDGEEREANGAEFKALKRAGWEKIYKYKNGEALTPGEAKAKGLDEIKDKKSKNAVQRSRYLNDWNDEGNVEIWRAQFADLQNKALAAAGSTARVDHRSHARRGIEALPQMHEGVAVRAIERKAKAQASAEGVEYAPVTERRAENDAVALANAALARRDAAIKALMAEMEAEIAALREKAREAALEASRDAAKRSAAAAAFSAELEAQHARLLEFAKSRMAEANSILEKEPEGCDELRAALDALSAEIDGLRAGIDAAAEEVAQAGPSAIAQVAERARQAVAGIVARITAALGRLQDAIDGFWAADAAKPRARGFQSEKAAQMQRRAAQERKGAVPTERPSTPGGRDPGARGR